jgi:hypothetical protein
MAQVKIWLYAVTEQQFRLISPDLQIMAKNPVLDRVLIEQDRRRL